MFHKISNKGFTLMEVMLAITLMSFAALTGFQVLRTEIMRFQNLIHVALPRARAGVVMAQLEKDLREAYVSPDVEQSFFAAPSSNQFAFTKHIPDLSAESMEEIGYDLSFDRDGISIWRRSEIPSVGDPLSGGRRSLLISGVKEVSFSFFDGREWKTSWGWDDDQKKVFRGIRGMPLFVAVEIDGSRRVFPIMTTLLNWKASNE